MAGEYIMYIILTVVLILGIWLFRRGAKKYTVKRNKEYYYIIKY